MPGDGSDGRLSDGRNLLGFVVAGFAGVLNFIGLKSAEVGVVLRNEPFRVSIVGVLLLLGVVTAALSIFVTKDHPIYPGWMFGLGALAAAAFPLLIWIIPSPFPGQGSERAAAMWVAIGCGLLAALLVGVSVRAHVPGRAAAGGLGESYSDLFNLQCLLLVVALILTSAAAYGALRMETISQTSPLAQIGDSLTVSGQQDELSISISASKMSDQEWLGLNVQGAPRTWQINAMCGAVKENRGVRCTQDPCYYFHAQLNEECAELSEDVLPPDSSGGVQRTIVVPFSPRQYQHLNIAAYVCQPATSKKAPPGTCQPLEDVVNSRLDVAIPELPAAGPG